MSCKGWRVGDRCIVIRAFAVVLRQINGPTITYSMLQSDEGTIQGVLDRPSKHHLSIHWDRLAKTVSVPDDKFGFLQKI
jgi:hypothetical protein